MSIRRRALLGNHFLCYW